MAKQLWKWYNKHLDSNPFKTKAVLCLSISLFADANAQIINFVMNKNAAQIKALPYEDDVEKQLRIMNDTNIDNGSGSRTQAPAAVQPVENTFSLDMRRQGAIATLALVYQAPFSHWWFGFLDRTSKRFVKPAYMVPFKVLMDQCIDACLGTTLYMSLVPFLEGRADTDWIYHKMRLDFIPTWLIDCLYWPAVQAVNFAFVPVKHQFLVMNLGVVFWQVFMSLVCHDDSLLRRMDKFNPFTTEKIVEEDIAFLEAATAQQYLSLMHSDQTTVS